MIAFATAEDALDVLYLTTVAGPYTEAPDDVNAHAYADAARDRVLSELTALRAENARLREQLDGRERAAELACENPPTGCECPGCSQARDEAARAALDAPPNTALARSAVAWCLCRIGSWTNARWDQHLRDKFGDDIAEEAGAFLLSVGINVETFARQPVSAALDAKEVDGG